MSSSDKEHNDCECMACEKGIDALLKWQDECIQKYGFYMHAVKHGQYVNYHTHGFVDSWQHPDMQMVIPVDAEFAKALFWDFAREIKAGKKYQVGDILDGFIEDHNIRLTEAKECGRAVLRVIFPDQNGKFPGDPDCDAKYERQLTLNTDEGPDK